MIADIDTASHKLMLLAASSAGFLEKLSELKRLREAVREAESRQRQLAHTKKAPLRSRKSA